MAITNNKEFIEANELAAKTSNVGLMVQIGNAIDEYKNKILEIAKQDKQVQYFMNLLKDYEPHIIINTWNERATYANVVTDVVCESTGVPFNIEIKLNV